MSLMEESGSGSEIMSFQWQLVDDLISVSIRVTRQGEYY